MNPETCMRELTTESLQMRAKKYGAIELQQPNVDDIGMEKCGPFLYLYGMLEVTSYSSCVVIGRVTLFTC
ncbi:hypothetical protein RchiOBHm_Chr7g0190171 [Rosa chinensis]|uniref:Uncharacterized protein n=1 Tax=Rosa chinensis TaxID=74649 RepID=A0A2P6P4Y6_ROSCH|nr:hypothetical protein RchiOBHm_Chr7g0190171 [Rosa chinensis]